MATPELIDAVMASSKRLGINPSDLLTAISYETAGTFDPWKAGPTTQHGRHYGLIQWGGPQREKYGVTADMSVPDQMRAVERYLTDAGVKPGHGLLDIYSAINAGRVGLYDRSDANKGGAPGTVADKVATQMVGHRAKANSLLSNYKPADPNPDPGFGPGPVVAQAPTVPAPDDPYALPPLTPPPGPAAIPNPATTPSATTDAATANSNPFGNMAQVAALLQKQQQAAQPAPQPMKQIDHPELEYMRKAQIAQAALARQQQGI